MKILNYTFMIIVSMTLIACTGNENQNTLPRTGDTGLGANPETTSYFNEVLGDTVLFEVNKSTLDAQALAILDAQADWLLTYPNYFVEIEGHTDEQGTREYNLALGARRAAAVQNYLISRGLTYQRIATLTYGKERPLLSCSNEKCWSLNRRSVSKIFLNTGS